MQPDSSPSQSGFSVVEGLIAVVVLMVISLGIVPLFTRSMKDNSAGYAYLQSTNIGRTTLEELRELSFDSPELTIPPGSTELVADGYWSILDEQWKDGSPSPGDPARWLRKVTVRQYGSADLKDDGRLNSPLDGGSTSDAVHIKEIEVAIEAGTVGTALGPGKAITLTHLKTF